MENSWIFPVIIATAILSIIGFAMASYTINLAKHLKDEYDYMRRVNDSIMDHVKSVIEFNIKLVNENEGITRDEPRKIKICPATNAPCCECVPGGPCAIEEEEE